MKAAIIFIRYQMVPTVSFGFFIAIEAVFLYGLYWAFIAP